MKNRIFNLQPDNLEDNLIYLKPLKEEDFDKLYAVASDQLIWELHPIKDRYKKEVFKEFFESAVASKGAFLVFDKLTNELIGSSRYYDLYRDYSRVTIGFTFLARKYWGGVYNKSLKKLMIDYAFNFVEKIMFSIGSSNIRSQKAILKIGAKRINNSDISGNGDVSSYEYEIIRSEWKMKDFS